MRKTLGVACVLLGASCYGVQSTFVKMAYAQGYTPADVLTSQFVIGAAVLGLLTLVPAPRRAGAARKPAGWKDRGKLLLGGGALGATGAFYYLSVAQTSVATAVVLLMQSVWMGVALEAILARRAPPARKWAASSVIVLGALVATDMFAGRSDSNVAGVVYGLLAAFGYTAVIWCSQHVAVAVAPVTRSFLMIVGGAIVAIALFLPQLLVKFDPSVFWTWGWIVAVLGTILPPFLFNEGVPATGVGLATIVAAVELPVAVGAAAVVLHERFSATRWIGVALILVAIAASNLGAASGRPSAES